MSKLRRNPVFLAVAVIAPLMAVAPVLLGLSGGWVALHLIGGAISLLVLCAASVLLPSPWRWYAVAGVAASLAIVAVVTDGRSISGPVQLASFALLGVIYVACVFWKLPTQPST